MLLLLVTIIWGIIFYRIVFVASSDPILSATESIQPVKYTNTSVPDTFSIFANYRDPFFNKIIPGPASNLNKVKAPTPAKVEKIVVPLKWPSLSYGGIIKNQKSGKQLVLININGEESIIKAGDEISGIHLLKVYKDSIEVSFQKEKKTVSK